MFCDKGCSTADHGYVFKLVQSCSNGATSRTSSWTVDVELWIFQHRAEHKENDFVDLRGMGCVLKKFCFAAVAEFKVKENDVFPIRQHHEDPSPI